MKRISLLAIATLIAVSTATIGYSQHHVPARYQIRYSPYAFGKDHCGLVPYYLRYSPYARSAHHNGLVPYWVRYSPYAFSNKHSGLISDYGYGCYYSPGAYSSCACNCRADDCNTDHALSTHSRYEPKSLVSMKERYEINKPEAYKLAARRQKIEQLKNSRREIKKIRQKDRKEIICRYLENQNLNDYQMARVLKIDNRTVGVDFILRDKNIIIKYWNPRAIKSLAQQSQYKRSFYNRYRQRSEEFCGRYEQAGGKVYEIVSDDEEEILAKLQLCPELDQG